MDNDLKQILLTSLLRDSDEKNETNKEAVKLITCSELSTFHNLLNERYEFKVGDFVEWKAAGLKDRSFPAVGEPAIILDILENPIIDSETDVGSPAFNQKYDCILGVSVNGIFMTFYYSSSRFKIYSGK